MITVEDLIIEGKKQLHSHEAKMLLASVLKYDSLELLTHLDEFVPKEKVELFRQMLKARKEDYPLQYIIGDVDFLGQKILVEEKVLIPRFETEELVEKTLIKIEELFPNQKLKILDLCCGTGAIALSLKNKLEDSFITCSDISEEAINLSRKNAHNLNKEIEVIQSDLFENIEQKYDVIISNPPYIGEDEEIESVVLNHEPHLALFAKENGLEFYIKILKDARNYLNDKYLIAFEIGAEQKESVFLLKEKYFPEAKFECHQDLSGRDRIIFIFN